MSVKKSLKTKYKRFLAFLVTLCLTAGLISFMPITVQAANYWDGDGWTEISSLGIVASSTTQRTLTGNYKVTSNTTIATPTAATGRSGLTISGTTTIYIASGVTLTVTGATGSGRATPGGAGINLPSGATLIIRGAGTLNARGGNGGAATNGTAGTNGVINHRNNGGGDSWRAGNGGAGGNGASGGGAGIGTNGGTGGTGGATREAHDAQAPANTNGATNGRNGNSGNAGGTVSTMGTLRVLDTVTVTGTAGSGGSRGSTAAAAGAGMNDAGSGWNNDYQAGGGGGGGSGGAGATGSGIGAGGRGGGGGGSGGTGGRSNGNNGSNTFPNGAGGTGGLSANTNGVNGSGTQVTFNNRSGGTAGAGGGIGTAGGNGSVIKASGATVTGAPSTTAPTTRTLTTTAVTNMTVSATPPIDGTAFHATLTPNAGYSRPAATAVTVTMGGTTQTGVYTQSTGIITIPNVTGNIVITAPGVAQSYTITLGVNGGTAGAGGTTHSVTHMAVPNNIPANRIPTRANHIFNGFWTAASSGSRVFDTNGAAVASITNHTNASRQWIGTSSITLQAQWLRVHNVSHTGTNATLTNTGTNAATQGSAWTGTLSVSAGHSRPTSITVTRGTTNITNNVTYNSSTGAITIPAAQVTAATAGQAFTITAAGVPNTYTITFNANDGIGGTETATAIFNAAMPNITIPTKKGHAFGGYWTEPDGGGIQYYTNEGTSARNWNLTSNTTLYALWTSTFNAVATVDDEDAPNFTAHSANLEYILENHIVTDEDIEYGNLVTLTLTVSEEDETADGADEIMEAAQGRMLQFFDITVKKQINNDPVQILSILPVPVQITIDLSPEMSGRTGYTVYRFHDNEVQLLGMDTNADEYFVVRRNGGGQSIDQVIIYAKNFSTYAVVENIRTIEGAPGSDYVDVKARIIDLTTPVYRIDIEWGEMKFTYNLTASLGTWNPDTQSYENPVVEGWSGFEEGNNEVIVTNHSNANVLADFEITANELENVHMNLYTSNVNSGTPATNLLLGKVPRPTENPLDISAFLRLSGEPSPADITKLDGNVWHRIGIITVTITPNGDTLTPLK